MTADEFEAFIKQANADGGKFTTEEAETFLKTMLGQEELTDDLAVQYGYETVEGWIASLTGASEAFETEQQEIHDNLVVGVQDTVNGLMNVIGGSLTNAERAKIATLIEEAYMISGESGADFVASLIQSAGSESAELAEAFDTIDWKTADVNTLSAALKEAGISTNFTVNELDELINVMAKDGPKAAETLAKEF
jgi:coenzyme F420-reducing hydrogenase alpha subunit